jgi:hypothetical protein
MIDLGSRRFVMEACPGDADICDTVFGGLYGIDK